MSAEVAEIKNDFNILTRDIRDMKGILDAVAQLLRDSQVNQAGSDKLSYHTRLQIMAGIEELQKWTIRAEKTLGDLKMGTDTLEEDHDSHDEMIQEIHQIVTLNNKRFEQLLGYRADPVGNPLRNNIQEAVQAVRSLTYKDIHTGEPLDGWRIGLIKVREAFWSTIGVAVLLFLLWALKPYLPIPEHNHTPAPTTSPATPAGPR